MLESSYHALKEGWILGSIGKPLQPERTIKGNDSSNSYHPLKEGSVLLQNQLWIEDTVCHLPEDRAPQKYVRIGVKGLKQSP